MGNSPIPGNLTDIRAMSATTLALLGVINWGMEKYLFHGATPTVVATALYVLAPAVFGYLTTHVALNMVSPRELKDIRAKFQAAVKSGKGSIVMPQEKTLQVPEGPGGSLTITRIAGDTIKVTAKGGSAASPVLGQGGTGMATATGGNGQPTTAFGGGGAGNSGIGTGTATAGRTE